MTEITTLYTITASYDANGTRVDSTTAETIGLSHGQLLTRETADLVLPELEDSIADHDLDPSTEYSTQPHRVDVDDLSVRRDREHVIVTADVWIEGVGCYYACVTYGRDRVTGSGIDGYEPDGDSIDQWCAPALVFALGGTTAVHVCRAILGAASEVRS